MSQINLKSFFVCCLFLLMLISCQNKSDKVDVSSIPSNIQITRFDKIFSNANETNFKEIKSKYHFLFPGDNPDSFWLSLKNDSIFRMLFQESEKEFGNFEDQKKEIALVFKHVKYYYPSFKEPNIFTIISNLDTENQIIYADSILFISLDTYLGEKKEFYADTPAYIAKHFVKDRIPIDVASSIANETSPKIPYRTFVEKVVALGKIKYAVQKFVPNKSEAEILGYSNEQMDWAKNNEFYMWQYFMEKKYLYNTDKDLQLRFIDNAPFSKFYIESDSQSPGQIGIWLGLQIVKSYMQYNDVTLPEMMATPPLDIFNKSKYKPNK